MGMIRGCVWIYTIWNHTLLAFELWIFYLLVLKGPISVPFFWPRMALCREGQDGRERRLTAHIPI